MKERFFERCWFQASLFAVFVFGTGLLFVWMLSSRCLIADPDDFTCQDMVEAWTVQDQKYYASNDAIAVPAHIKDKCLILTAPWLNKHAECVLKRKLALEAIYENPKKMFPNDPVYTDNGTHLHWSLSRNGDTVTISEGSQTKTISWSQLMKLRGFKEDTSESTIKIPYDGGECVVDKKKFTYKCVDTKK